jgi:hypothetical protein
MSLAYTILSLEFDRLIVGQYRTLPPILADEIAARCGGSADCDCGTALKEWKQNGGDQNEQYAHLLDSE